MKALRVATGLLLLFSVWSAQAADSVLIRLVEAVQEGPSDTSGIEDVVRLLKETLGVTHYRLRAQTSMALPAENVTRSLSEYAVTCTSGQDKSRLAVTVRYGGRELLTTEISLKSNSPVVLVLSSGKKRSMVLVLTLP